MKQPQPGNILPPHGRSTSCNVLPGLRPSLVLALAVAGCLALTPVQGQNPPPPTPDVLHYAVGKGRLLVQPLNGPPAVSTNDPAHRFLATVSPAASGAVTGATVRAPSGTLSTLTEDTANNLFMFEQGFTSKALLDSAFASGAYAFRIRWLNDGTQRPTLTLPPDAYPGNPTVMKLADAQLIEPGADFTLEWGAFPGGTSNEFIRLVIEDSGGNTILETPSAGLTGALNGTNTSQVIPANTLAIEQTYRGRLLFARITSIDYTNYVSVPGITMYFKETQFPLATTSNPPPQGRFVFSNSAADVRETNARVTLSVLRQGGSLGSVSVLVTTSNSTATAGADYTAFSQRLDFGDGESNRTFSVTIHNDWLLEGTETFQLRLSNPEGGAAVGAPSRAIVRILDDETAIAGTLEFKKSVTSVSETSAVALVKVIRTGGTNGTVSVRATTRNDSAQAGADYVAVNTNLVFGPGVLNRSLAIPLINDAIVESNETVAVVLSEPNGGASLGLRTNAALSIINEDIGGVIAFGAPTFSVGESAGMAEITLVRTGGLAGGVSVLFSTKDQTASNGVDYLTSNLLVPFEKGETSKVVDAPIILPNSLADGARVLALQLRGATGGAALGAVSNATLTIVDDEVGVQFRKAGVTNVESIGFTLVQVERTGSTNGTVSVDYLTENGTATAGVDFSNTVGRLTFAPGVKRQWISLPIINDALVEPGETFSVVLTNVSGANALLGARSRATVSITDDDQGGVVAFTGKTFTASEGAKWALLTVSRSNGLAGGVSVNFATLTTGTAQVGTDFVPTNGTLSFGAGVSQASFRVRILDNFGPNANRTVKLRLSNPQGGAMLGTLTNATVTILDDDVSVSGVYQLANMVFLRSCGGNTNSQGRLTLNQIGDAFNGDGLFFDGDGGTSRIRMTGTLGVGGAISGVFTNDTYGGSGSFNGSVTNSGIRVTISGADPGGTCAFDGLLSASRYAPTSAGFAPTSIAGRNVQVNDPTYGSFKVKFLATGDRYEEYNLAGTILEESGLVLYTKTAANTGTLLMSDGDGDNSQVTLTFTSANGGTFLDAEGSTGTFAFLP